MHCTETLILYQFCPWKYEKKILKSRILLSKIAEIFSTALMAIAIAKVQDNLSFYTMYLGYITLAMRPCPIFFHAWMRQSRLQELLYFCTVCAKKCEKKGFAPHPKLHQKLCTNVVIRVLVLFCLRMSTIFQQGKLKKF